MEIVELIVEVLKYIGPAIVVMLGMKLVLDQNRTDVITQQRAWAQAEVLKEHLPLKLAAYERAMLFLERIKPEQLLLRETGNIPAKALSQQLIRQIQEEYEHNIAQQIYMTPAAWSMVVAAKDQVLNLLITSAQTMSEEGDAQAFKNLMLSNYHEQEQKMIQVATLALKRDVGQVFSLTGE